MYIVILQDESNWSFLNYSYIIQIFFLNLSIKYVSGSHHNHLGIHQPRSPDANPPITDHHHLSALISSHISLNSSCTHTHCLVSSIAWLTCLTLTRSFSIPVQAPPPSPYFACLSLLTHLIQIISLLEVRSMHELCSDWHAPYTGSIAPYTGSIAPYTGSIARISCDVMRGGAMTGIENRCNLCL